MLYLNPRNTCHIASSYLILRGYLTVLLGGVVLLLLPEPSFHSGANPRPRALPFPLSRLKTPRLAPFHSARGRARASQGEQNLPLLPFASPFAALCQHAILPLRQAEHLQASCRPRGTTQPTRRSIS